MNELKQVWRALDAKGKAKLARKLDTSKDYLSQIAYDRRNPGKHFKISLEREIKRLSK